MIYFNYVPPAVSGCTDFCLSPTGLPDECLSDNIIGRLLFSGARIEANGHIPGTVPSSIKKEDKWTIGSLFFVGESLNENLVSCIYNIYIYYVPRKNQLHISFSRSKLSGIELAIFIAASWTVWRPLATEISSLQIIRSMPETISGRSLPSAFEYYVILVSATRVR